MSQFRTREQEPLPTITPNVSLCAANLYSLHMLLNVYHPQIPAESLSERREAYNTKHYASKFSYLNILLR